MPTPDDTPEVDAAIEWAESQPTTLDPGQFVEAIDAEASEQVTKPHALAPIIEEARAAGVEAGCRNCYAEGQEDAIGALKSLMLEKGAANDEVAATVAHVRLRLTKL